MIGSKRTINPLVLTLQYQEFKGISKIEKQV